MKFATVFGKFWPKRPFHFRPLKLKIPIPSLPAVLCVALIGLSAAAPAKGPSCTKACPFDYAPVCGGPETGAEKPLSFGNACVLENYNCEKGLRKWEMIILSVLSLINRWQSASFQVGWSSPVASAQTPREFVCPRGRRRWLIPMSSTVWYH